MLPSIDTSPILPLIGVALGWLLGEIGSLRKTRGEQRRVLGRAMLELLKVRESLMLQHRTFTLAKTYASQGTLGEHTALLRELRGEGITEPFEDVETIVKEIASIDPILAFDLHQRANAITSILKTVAVSNRDSDENLKQFFEGPFWRVEQAVFEAYADELKRAILRLARRKGLFSLRKARGHFKNELVQNNDLAALAGQLVGIKADALPSLKKTNELAKGGS